MSNIIAYNTFNRYSYCTLELSKMLPSTCFNKHESKNISDVLLEVSPEEVYMVISNYFPNYRKFYKSNSDSRYMNLMITLLQDYSEIILCPLISDIGFLGDLDNKIQFCFCNKINISVDKHVATIIPQYIFEISFTSNKLKKCDLRKSYSVKTIQENMSEITYQVIYKMYKLNDDVNKRYSTLRYKNVIGKERNTDEGEYTEYVKINTEEEMYDRIRQVMDEGYLPVRNNRLVYDIRGDLYTIEQFKHVNYDVVSDTFTNHLNTDYKDEVIDMFYNSKNAILPHMFRSKLNRSISTMTYDKNNMNNILHLAKMKLSRK